MSKSRRKEAKVGAVTEENGQGYGSRASAQRVQLMLETVDGLWPNHRIICLPTVRLKAQRLHGRQRIRASLGRCTGRKPWGFESIIKSGSSVQTCNPS